MPAGTPGPVILERYAEALGSSEPIESLRKAPKRLKKLLKGLSEKQLARRPAPGKWSIKEVLAHLADGEVMLGSRFRLVAAMDRPPLVGYDQDAFVERLALERAKGEDLLEDFAAVRGANVRLLKRLPDEAFARVGLHSERGEESLHGMLIMYAGHDLVHEAQVEGLRAWLRAESKADRKARRKGESFEPRSKGGKQGKRGKPAKPGKTMKPAEPAKAAKPTKRRKAQAAPRQAPSTAAEGAARP